HSRGHIASWLVLAAIVGTTAACGLGPQPPQVAPADAGAPTERIMLVGDSLLAQAEPAITSELATHHLPAVLLDHATGGWGLLTPLQPGTASRPADLVGQWIAQEHPDVVVAEFSGNYWPGQDGPDDYLSVAWTSRWDTEADRLTRAVLATGTRLVWVIPPPRSSVETTWYGLRDLSVFESVVHPGVGLVDWWTPATSREGHWVLYVDDGDGHGYRKLRLDDGLHFTADGQERLAKWFVAGLRDLWDTPTTTTTTT
ncbi:MAG TPA: hypothetical protein VFC99_08455, partial [Acidimicrobiia bacterium]|nr:hypothetical protein [Acidimicrobiia bacterium]